MAYTFLCAHKNKHCSTSTQFALFNLTDENGEEAWKKKAEVRSASNLGLVSLSHRGNARVSTYYQVLDRDHERMCLHGGEGGERIKKRGLKKNHVYLVECFLKIWVKSFIIHTVPICVHIFFKLQCFPGCPSYFGWVLDISWGVLTYWVSLPHQRALLIQMALKCCHGQRSVLLLHCRGMCIRNL